MHVTAANCSVYIYREGKELGARFHFLITSSILILFRRYIAQKKAQEVFLKIKIIFFSKKVCAHTQAQKSEKTHFRFWAFSPT